jgi:NADPH:quinone reductase-like Zn-dependent oxidoreductase
MRQVVITKHGPPEVLQVRESPDPEASDGQIRVRVRATGINFADLSARMGLYPDAPKPPCVVGYEVAGTVDQVGAGVSEFTVGQRVFAMPRFGGHTDTLVVSAAQAFPMPDKMSFEEAPALPVAYLTAHHMMLYTGTLHRGDKVLIHSAAGGVGLAAIQLARAHGCVLFGTASKSKHDFLRAEGVAHPLDSSGDIVKQVRDVIGAEGGLDLVLDPIGGRSWRDGYALLGPAGRLVCFGFSSAQGEGKKRNLLHAGAQVLKMPRFNPMSMMGDNKSVTGVNMGHLFHRLDLLRPQFAALVAMYDRGEIKPHVDRSFPFAEAAAAHHYIHDRKAKGKVVLVP